MKKLFLLIGIFFITFCYSQEGELVALNHNTFNEGSNISNGGTGVWVKQYFSSSSNVEGSNYLFNHWLNIVEIYTLNKKRYKVSGVNFNVNYNRFEARLSDVSKDSIFIFNSNDIDKVVVGQREFVKKEVVGKRANYFVEVIQQGQKVSLLKSFSTRLVVGASNPMTKEKITDDKIVIIPIYYIERNGQLEEAKLKKSSILKLMSDKRSELKGFLKDNKISFKQEDDFKKLVGYYNSI